MVVAETHHFRKAPPRISIIIFSVKAKYYQQLPSILPLPENHPAAVSGSTFNKTWPLEAMEL